MFTRRNLIHAGCTIAGVTLIPHFMDRAKARMPHGGPASSPFGLSKRNVVNVNFEAGENDYAFIDHMKCGSGNWGPFSSGFTGAAPTFSSTLDANGWPSISSANGQTFGGNINVPDPANFNGPYVFDLDGNGTTNIGIFQPAGSVGTFTPGNGSNGMPAPVHGSVTFNSGGTIQFTSNGGASKGSFQFTFTSTSTGPQTISIQTFATGASGFFAKNIRFYRAADATDLGNGLIFRRPWKQPLVDLCPSAIRFMNWLGGVSSLNNRFENRTLPTNAGWGFGANWVASPNYQTDATGNNQMVVATATPTSGIPQSTPTNMVHGEICTFRTPSTGGTNRLTNGLTVTRITNATSAVVTTASAHPYANGDIVVHNFGAANNITGNINSTVNLTITSPDHGVNIVNGMFIYGPGIPANTTVVSGGGTASIVMSNAATISAGIGLAFRSMQNLHLLPCTVSNVTTLTYQINVDTTSMGIFSHNSAATVTTCQFLTLQVGSGGSGQFPRVAYPCVGTTGGSPFAIFAAGRNASSYYTAWFDKTLSCQTDGSGNYIKGAWIFVNNPSAHNGDVPIEVCVALINELNAMSPAHTIGMWMNIPEWGLSSMDPDYVSTSDWAVNAADTVLNPSSVVRTSGYSALGYSGSTKLNSPVLIIEYSNEPWNFGAAQYGYLLSRGIQRWPTIYPYQDYQDMQSLRSTCMVRDVKAALSGSLLTNTKFILGMFGTDGMVATTSNQNYAVCFAGNVTANPIFAGDWYINDTLVTSGSWGTPISNHDGVAPASYFDPVSGYYNAFGVGSFSDDSAMYNGTDNSGTLSMTGGTPSALSATFTAGNPSIACTNSFVAGQPVMFGTTVGNISSANTTYVVSATGLSSSTFQVTNNSGTVTPSANGTSAVNMPRLLAITAVGAGAPVLNQALVGTGIVSTQVINPGGATGVPVTTITAINGTSPNFVLTLSQNAAVAGATTITSPSPSISWQGTVAAGVLTLTGASTQTINSSQAFTGSGVPAGTFVIKRLSGTNGAIASTYQLNNSGFTISSPVTMSNAGGNYISSANQSQALANFVNLTVDANNYFTTESPTRYATVLYPQYSTVLGPTKDVLGYEGGADWVSVTGVVTGGNTVLSPGDAAFSFAAINSSQWGTAQTNFFNTISLISNVFMGAIYLWINARWGYANPDSYPIPAGSGAEGDALTIDSASFIAMANRNVALPN